MEKLDVDVNDVRVSIGEYTFDFAEYKAYRGDSVVDVDAAIADIVRHTQPMEVKYGAEIRYGGMFDLPALKCREYAKYVELDYGLEVVRLERCDRLALLSVLQRDEDRLSLVYSIMAVLPPH